MKTVTLHQTKNRYELFKSSEMKTVATVESALIRGARKYFEANKFTEVVVPHLTKATGACENVDTLFEVDYFGQKSYLSQTGQLYLESLIPLLGGVFCVGSSFRAEPDVDSRHATEFTLVEIEFPGDFKLLLEHIEGTIKSMILEALKTNMPIDKERLTKALAKPFNRLTYADAIKLLKENGFDVEWGDDLKSKHEAKIVELLGNHPTFITHYPEKIKFFNMIRNKDNPETVNSTDLILPLSGEAVGAAEREYEHDSVQERLADSVMLKNLEKKGGTLEDFRWYLDSIKKNGSVPHAGCGIGLSRVTQYVLGIADIRATTPYPMNRETLY
jgi:asparaginyl-tRNA synthetase